MKFGEKLHNLRKQAGLTQAELAKILGVHPRTVIGYERDGRYPKDNNAYKKLADIFHVPVQYFYDDDEKAAEKKQNSLPWNSLKFSPQENCLLKIWITSCM